MATREQLQSDLKAAMRAGADVRKSTLRMILAAVKLA
ncbi:MAG: GatB/YqeY domain-containing protein, partial [Chloroflexi bacterium]|nr:GatB/YqeY domain-containing protein [Chloroflexota bacterium]